MGGGVCVCVCVRERGSDILVIYPELNMLRYECDNNYWSYLKM